MRMFLKIARKASLISFCIFLIIINLIMPNSEKEIFIVGKYEIQISDNNILSVKVNAELTIHGDTLYIHPICPNYDYPKGWSTFIKNLKITNSSNKQLSYEYLNNSKWILKEETEEKINLSYEVDLSFITEEWDVGNEQAGILLDNSVFVVTRALFITTDTNGQYEVGFKLPALWKLSTAWKPITNRHDIYMASNKDDLNNNTIVWGNHKEYLIQEGNFSFKLALLGKIKESAKLISSTLKKVSRGYNRLFPDTPTTNYLISIFHAKHNDGEAYERSHAITIRNPISTSNILIWGNLIAHELFHYWNGRLMRGVNRTDRQWFSEGFTDYYAAMTLKRQDLISEKLLINHMEKILGLYAFFRERQFPDVSLKESGKKKSTYRFGVYNGGWAAALVLDITLIEKTGGDKRLDDFMHLMFTKYGLINAKYHYDDIIITANEIAGIDLSDFFNRYISGIELLPFEECLKKLGYDLDYTPFKAVMYINKKDNLTKSNIEMKNKWLADYL